MEEKTGYKIVTNMAAQLSPEEYMAFKRQMRRIHEATCNNWRRTHGKPMRKWMNLYKAAKRVELAEMRKERRRYV